MNYLDEITEGPDKIIHLIHRWENKPTTFLEKHRKINEPPQGIIRKIIYCWEGTPEIVYKAANHILEERRKKGHLDLYK